MDDTTESTKGLDTLAFNGGLALSIDDISLGGECRSGITTAIERRGEYAQSLDDSSTGLAIDPLVREVIPPEQAPSATNRALALDGIAITNRPLTQKNFSCAPGGLPAPWAIVANTKQTHFAFAAANIVGLVIALA